MMVSHDMAETLGFFRAWLKAPLRVAAVTPSGRALAKLITSEINRGTGPVIELGPGTGSFTRILLAHSVRQEDLVLVEFGAALAENLHQRFPNVRTLCMDAARLRGVHLFDGRAAAAVVSALPLSSMPRRKVIGILKGAFDKMRADGVFYQFTYGPRFPVPQRLLDRLGLQAEQIGSTLADFPPASVYRLSRIDRSPAMSSFSRIAIGGKTTTRRRELAPKQGWWRGRTATSPS